VGRIAHRGTLLLLFRLDRYILQDIFGKKVGDEGEGIGSIAIPSKHPTGPSSDEKAKIGKENRA
jgi:hypothetical protein